METKKKSLSDTFIDLMNPAPRSYDPEDDIYTDTVAKVVEYEDDFSEEVFTTSRKRNIDLIEEGDERYDGRKVSRKTLGLQSASEDEFECKEIGLLNLESKSLSGSEEENENEESEDESIGLLESKSLSGSEEQNENRESEDESTGDDSTLQTEDNEDLNHFQHISSRGLETELEKSNAVMNQLHLWDSFLECRIKVQKTLAAANKLPRYNTFQHFVSQGGSNFKAEIRRTKYSLTTLLQKLIELQTKMLKSYPETNNLNKAKDENIPTDDEEICSDTDEEKAGDPTSDAEDSNKLSGNNKHNNLEYFSQLLADQHKNYREYRNATIQKWNDKTRISVGKLSSRNFSTFEQSTLKQIEQILSNRQRLIQRTQLNRTSGHILGQLSSQEPEVQSDKITENIHHLKTDHEVAREYDTEIYDDTDYYQQLLREVIERKSSDVTDPVQLGRKWLELQKLRSKMKRKVDTRATKGRKIRYVVHPKLVNFMAPVSQNTWNEEAKTELFGSLFGNKTRQQ
ncbi:hypothetical protein ANN_11904 [Periplaneta americana]|uniref:Protein AATF n=1 Tax=Periplaneta americana TaxID=6978 RepID=A0ABQ8T7U5_PERAM|nr:hypothetical protein ANN_11904 [Periplaneta americana]